MMRRHLSLLLAYFAQFIKSRLSYRGDFIVDTIAVMIALSVHLVFLGVVYSKVQSLQGWSFEQLLFIYGFSLIPLGIFNLVSSNLWDFSDGYLIEGRFDRVLLRPVNPLFQILFESLNIASLGEVVVGVMILIGAGAKLGISPAPLDLVLFPVLALSAAAVYLGVFLLLTSFSFWFEDRLGIGAPIYNVIRFARYPVNIFHPVVRVIISWVIPFAFAAFYPASHFLREHEYRAFAILTPVVAAITMAGAMAVFTIGTRRYRSTGS
jgi:ABC-2 type transport system permease protein